jgi:hypothetical protein
MRKRRTRAHIIADLSVHRVEGFVLRCGWTVERTRFDYGIDLDISPHRRFGKRQCLVPVEGHLKPPAVRRRSFRFDWSGGICYFG